jgi:thymidylate synthase (FAD)
MNVTVVRATENPVEVISLAAGICYGKSNATEKRVDNCVKMGHTSILEHAAVTFKVEGVSRACMAQLTRHRMASFCVESQRYNKYDLNGCDWYVLPPAFAENTVRRAHFETAMALAAADYGNALDEGIKPEDARYLLPEATKTNLFVTMNARELFHFFDMRRDRAAQWEIRGLAEAMASGLEELGGEWAFLMGLWSECKETR